MPVAKLHIAPNVALPLDLALSSIGDFGQRGTGKTYTLGVLVEDMLQAGLQVVVIDPTDVWWGLRSRADGQADGYPVYVFGGPHADVPLEEGAGELIADVLVDSGISAVLSLRHLRKGAQHRFFTSFAERFYHRKGAPEHRTPVHVVIDEAHSFAPSTVRGDTAQMVGAVEDLVRLGRASGIGVSLVSQRPKSVNPNVRTQAEAIICHRLLDKLDRDAVNEWVSSHDDAGRAKDFMASLGGLKNGEAWVWHPDLDIFQRVQVRKKRTFDSSATPKIGETRIEPRHLAPVDVETLGARITATVEKAKADDPRAMRARIRELERELDNADRHGAVNEGLEAENESLRDTLSQSIHDNARLQARIEQYADAYAAILTTLEAIEPPNLLPAVELPDLSSSVRSVPIKSPTNGHAVSSENGSTKPVLAIRAPVRVQNNVPVVDGIGRGERKVLDVLADFPEGRSHDQLAFLAGYSANASTIGVILSKLRRMDLVESGQPIRLTEAGVAAAGGPRQRLTGDALLQQWLNHPRMGAGERKVLQILIDRYPAQLTHEHLCQLAGYSPSASTMGVILSKLRKLGLVESGARRAAPDLMEAIA